MWLGEVCALVLQQALADLNTAYRNFFASRTGRRKGPKIGEPRFRSRKDRWQAIRFTRNASFVATPGGKLRLPKIGDVPVRWSRPLPAVPSSVTVIRDAAGRYFASFVVQAGDDPLPEVADEAGIDLGLAHFAVLSDGRKIASPKFLRRAERKLRTAQKALSRRVKGSKNRDKARARVARIHAKVADARRDWLHKESTRIISKIGRFKPTSQVCSACGARDGPKPLAVRTWTCAACGTVHDRDVNAARNVLALGRRESLNARRGQVRPAPVLAPAGEPGSRSGAA